MTDSTIIGTFPIWLHTNALISIFDRYGKLLKVLLQLPLVGTEDIMVRIYHQMITGLL
jgi:hypothetical protein